MAAAPHSQRLDVEVHAMTERQFRLATLLLSLLGAAWLLWGQYIT